MDSNWGSRLTDVGKGLVKKVFEEDRVKKAKDDAEIHEIRLRSELHRRDILNNLIEEEVKKHENKQAITAKALPYLDADANPDKIDSDWIANFFDKHCLVSDEQAQDLLARILAGEANSPGKISKRTVNLLANFDQEDAKLFIALASFIRSIDKVYVPLIYDCSNSIYPDSGINFGKLMHLDSIGFLQFDNFSGFTLTNLPEKIIVEHDDGQMFLVLVKSQPATPRDYIVNIGSAYLTGSGFELLSIIQKKDVVKIPGFDEYLRSEWEKLGYKLEPIPD